MATEYAAPFGAPSSTTIATSQQFRDRNRFMLPDGIDADVSTTSGAGSGAVSDGGAGTSVNIQNVSAVVQGARYELSAGPLNLAVAANGGGSNRFDIVCLTYDASHNPGVYCRIVQGTPGAGLPALTHNNTGVWDFPLYHYEKTPAGAIVNLVDRRRYLNPNGNSVLTPSNQLPSVTFPITAARRGMRIQYWDPAITVARNGRVWEYDGTAWQFVGYIDQKKYPRARLFRSTTGAVADSVTTPITWTGEDLDTHNGHAASSTDYVSPQDGYYDMKISIPWANNAAGRRAAWFTSAGVDYNGNSQPGGGVFSAVNNVSRQIPMVAGDVCKVNVFQNSGGNLNVDGTLQDGCRWDIMWVSPL